MRVKDVCKSKGVSVTDLAARMGIAQESLSRAINGNPTLQTLERIAAALGVEVVDLFDQPAGDVVNCPYCGNKIKVGKE